MKLVLGDRIRLYAAAAIPILLGVAALAWMLSFARAEIFYSGDGGVKYLLAKQIAAGRITPALDLPADAATRALWDEGFYPFAPPFVYPIGGRNIVAFPVYFPLLSAPLLKGFGWRGLFVIPAGALVLTWLLAWRAARRRRWGATATTAMLACLIASPLTFYGAAFWEHTPGVLLASVPLLALGERGRGASARRRMFGLGALAGGAALFRPEAAGFAAAFVAARLALSPFGRRREAAALALGFAFACAAFMAANLAFYGNALGAHALESLGRGFASDEAFGSRARGLKQMLDLLRGKYPQWGAAAAGFPVALWARPRRRREAAICAATIVLGAVIAAAIAPNTGGRQWGARYLLPLLPWGAWLFGLAAGAAARLRNPWARGAALAALAIPIFAGAKQNLRYAGLHLKYDYAGRIVPTMEALRGAGPRFVIVTSRYGPQELAGLAEEKVFLFAQDGADIQKAARRLLALGEREVWFVSAHGREDMTPLWLKRKGRSVSPGDYSKRRVALEELIAPPKP